MGQVSIKGHIKDLFPTYSNDFITAGSYNTSPTALVYQMILVRGSDGTTAPSVYWSVKHEAYTELSYIDALVS